MFLHVLRVYRSTHEAVCKYSKSLLKKDLIDVRDLIRIFSGGVKVNVLDCHYLI